jgi:FkbM family methyltransferase
MPTPIPSEELAVYEYLNLSGVVVDVGARDDVEMYALKPQCEYHLFEPSTEYFNALKEKAEGIENIHLNNFGLSYKEDTSLYNTKQESFLRYLEGDTYSQRLTTLDAYCTEKGITAIDFLKIDTEGYDYRVLIGAKDILNTTRYIQFEYWDGVQKFYDMLSEDFHMYLMMEPRLRQACHEGFGGEGDYLFKETLIPLDTWLIAVIDKAFIPGGHGGNILCIRK